MSTFKIVVSHPERLGLNPPPYYTIPGVLFTGQDHNKDGFQAPIYGDTFLHMGRRLIKCERELSKEVHVVKEGSGVVHTFPVGTPITVSRLDTPD